MEGIISVGTKVTYRGCFGMDAPKNAVVTGIERSNEMRDKYGYPVEDVLFDEREYCVFNLNDGHWCYGEQIDAIAD